MIPIKLVYKFGFFLIPLFFFATSKDSNQPNTFTRLLGWLITVQLLVITVFVTDLQFLAGRYVGLILLLSTPFAASGLLRIFSRWPFLKKPTLALLVVLSVTNVFSTGSTKTYFVDAGRWLANYTTETPRIYIDSGRTAYHAGWKNTPIAKQNKREDIERAVSSRTYDLFVLEISRKDPPCISDFQKMGLEVIRRFESGNGDAVIVARPKENFAQ